MIDNLRVFSTNKILLNYINKALFHYRTQNYDVALRITNYIIDHLSILVDELIKQEAYFNKETQLYDNDFIQVMLTNIFDSQKQKDYVLLADYMELQLLPFIVRIQEYIISSEGFSFDEEKYEHNINFLKKYDSDLGSCISALSNPLDLLERGYTVEFTSSGLFTLAVSHGNKRQYLHSNNQVSLEAFILAKSWHDENTTDYIVYGLGLGYHVVELHKIDKNTIIEVYESDINIIQLALAFTDIGDALNNNMFKLIYDPDFTKLSSRLEQMDNDTEFVIHHPSLQVLPSSAIKEKLENYFIQYSSMKNQTALLNGNFKRNIRNFNGFLDELQVKFKKKSLYIIAAGPSLDQNFHQLKRLRENDEEGIILATGTVFKKLLKAGIKPDYVLVTDPNARVYKQIDGLEDSDIPMLYLSTAYHGFAKGYQGKKYMICQKDYPKAEEFAKENSLHCFRTGGSVSTTALDIGITFGCKRIIFLGLDLAYTDGFAHASDTSRRKATDFDNLRQVEDIHGNMIPTNRSLDMFRGWIENRIRDVKDIEFLDATEGGARIQGMKAVKLSEVISK